MLNTADVAACVLVRKDPECASMKLVTVLLALWTLTWLPTLFHGSPIGLMIFGGSLAATVACGLKAWPRMKGPESWPPR